VPPRCSTRPGEGRTAVLPAGPDRSIEINRGAFRSDARVGANADAVRVEPFPLLA